MRPGQENPSLKPASPVPAGRRLHPLPVRIMHWVNAVVMLVMITSGWGIYDDDVIIRGFHFSSFWRLGDWAAWSLNWHFAGMWFLVINGLIYLIYGFVSGRFREKLLPIRPAELVQTIAETLRFKNRARRHHRLQRRPEAALHRRHPCRHRPGDYRARDLEARAVLRPGFFAGRLPDRAGAALRGMAVIVGFLIVHVALALLVPKTLWAMVAGGPRLVGAAAPRKAGRSKATRHEIAVPTGRRSGCRDPRRP